MNEPKFRAALDAHRAAVGDFLSAAERVAEAQWAVPREEGKWSPADIAEHLAIAYDVLIDEMNGGPGMRVVTTWWQRLLLDFTVVPKLLMTGEFPKGARAPREVRPANVPAAKDAAFARLRQRSEEFNARIEAFAKNGSGRLTHAYFGKKKLIDVVRFCEVHVAHHRRQLA